MTVNPSADISAFEIVFEVKSTAGGAYLSALNVVWDPGLTVLTNRIVDLGGVDLVSPDTIRIAGMLTDAGDGCLGAGPKVVAQVQFTASDVCSGTVGLSGANFACPSTPVVATTQFVDCATTALVAATVTAGTITVNNQAPTISPIADATLPWGSAYSGQIVASDPDQAGCETLSYSKVSGPAALTVNATTGKIAWTTTGADVCTHVVEVAVTDKCGSQKTTSFTICVTNVAPVAICPADTIHLVWGGTASGSVSGTDPDSGPGALAYSLVSNSGPGTATINPATGAFSWPTLEDNSYIGLFELKFAVSDGANVCSPCSPNNADTCSVFVVVVPTIAVTIEKTHGTFQGAFEEVSVSFDGSIDPPNEMGGFDFLIQYDASALTFQAATPGSFIEECGWEYFTFRYGANGNCGPGACPSGVLRVVAIAETNNGANHPDCFSSTTATELVKLSFLVTNDRTFECMYVPIRFIWYDCGDNGISNKLGDTLYLSRHVYDYDNGTPVEDLGASFPTLYGAPAECDIPEKPDMVPVRLVDFFNGGIDIVCADSIDDRGDLNLNGTAYEIADAVLYSNYFVYGVGVFAHYEAQVAASDVNADGIPLSVGDLVYLIRVVVGDAQPYPKTVAPAEISLVNRQGTLSVSGDALLGAAYLTVAGNVTPTLLATNMELKYAYDAAENLTRVLVYSMQAEGFTGEFLTVTGAVVSLELATYEGYPVVTKQVPADFMLSQNYPNPFNPTTTISFGLPTASDYSLTIYNVSGQVVKTFSGTAEAGMVDLTWEAGDNASGIYLYRLEAGSFSQTKKMVLLK